MNNIRGETKLKNNEIKDSINLFNQFRTLDKRLNYTDYRFKLMREINNRLKDYFYEYLKIDKDEVLLLEEIKNFNHIEQLIDYQKALEDLVDKFNNYYKTRKFDVYRLRRRVRYVRHDKKRKIDLRSIRKIKRLSKNMFKFSEPNNNAIYNNLKGCPFFILHKKTEISYVRISVGDITTLNQMMSYYLSLSDYNKVIELASKNRNDRIKKSVIFYTSTYIIRKLLTLVLVVFSIFSTNMFVKDIFDDNTSKLFSNIIFISLSIILVLISVTLLKVLKSPLFDRLTKRMEKTFVRKNKDYFQVEDTHLNRLKYTFRRNITLFEKIMKLLLGVGTVTYFMFYVTDIKLNVYFIIVSLLYLFIELTFTNIEKRKYGPNSNSLMILTIKLPIYIYGMTILVEVSNALSAIGILAIYTVIINIIIYKIIPIRKIITRKDED